MREALMDTAMLKHGLRTCLRNPTFFFALAVSSLAIGIGLTSAVFAVMHAVVFRSLPYPDPKQLLVIYDSLPGARSAENLVSPGQFADWSVKNHSFEALGAYTDAVFNVGDQDAERIGGVMVTPSLMKILGTVPSQGRLFYESDWMSGFEPSHVVIVSSELWHRRFSAQRLSNQTILLADERYDVIGILPAGYFFLGKKVDAIVPIRFPPATDHRAFRGFRYLTVVGRMRNSVTKDAARGDLAAIAADLGNFYPLTDSGRSVTAIELSSAVFGRAVPGLVLLFATGGCLFLIACTNISSLFLARSIERSKETAIRLALGAGWRDLFQQILAETLIITGSATIAGLLFARFCLAVFLIYGPPNVPRFQDSTINFQVAAFAALLSTVSGLIVSLFSLRAWRAKHDLLTGLGDAQRIGFTLTGVRARSILMITEVGLAVFLLTGAGLTVKTLWRLLDTDPGFNSTGAIAMDISSPKTYSDEERTAFFERLLAAVSSLPGVQSVGITNRLPLSGDNSTRTFNFGEVPLTTDKQQVIEIRTISPGLPRAMGVNLVNGRMIEDGDTAGAAAVAVVNEAFVTRYSADQQVLGRTVFVQDGTASRPRRIIGTLRNVKHVSLSVDALPEVYVPYKERPYPNMSMIIRSAFNDLDIITGVRRTLSQINPQVPLANVRPLADLVVTSTSSERFRAFLLSAFSLCALIMSSVGIYGTTSYVMSGRRSEIGIRMALGAERKAIVFWVLSWGARRIFLAVFAGLILATIGERIAHTLLFGTSFRDWAVYAGATFILIVIAFVACIVPAIRASKIDPAATLRT